MVTLLQQCCRVASFAHELLKEKKPVTTVVSLGQDAHIVYEFTAFPPLLPEKVKLF